ncbi:MAG: hypothetical protein VKK04_03490 [Synechococcales bacterium]|nr:hypothetical protein [Synechococcales bacterium]
MSVNLLYLSGFYLGGYFGSLAAPMQALLSSITLIGSTVSPQNQVVGPDSQNCLCD